MSHRYLPIWCLLLCALLFAGGCGKDDNQQSRPEAPEYEQVLSDPQYSGAVLVFRQALPQDGNASMRSYLDPDLARKADSEGDSRVMFVWKVIKFLLVLAVIVIVGPPLLAIVGGVAAWSADGGFKDSVNAGAGAMLFVMGLAFVLLVAQCSSSDFEVGLNTINRYKEQKPAFFSYTGDVGVTVADPDVSLVRETVIDTNAYEHTYLRTLALSVLVRNELSVPLLMGEARCQLQIKGKPVEYTFPVYNKIDPDNGGIDRISDYWFLPANAAGNFEGEFPLVRLAGGNLSESDVQVLGCAVSKLMVDRNLLKVDNNAQVEVVSHGPGYVVLANHIDKAIKSVTLKCVPRTDRWSADELEKPTIYNRRQWPYSRRIENSTGKVFDPLRIGETGHYIIGEKKPQACVVAHYETY